MTSAVFMLAVIRHFSKQNIISNGHIFDISKHE